MTTAERMTLDEDRRIAWLCVACMAMAQGKANSAARALAKAQGKEV